MKKIWTLLLFILIMNSLFPVKAQFNLIPNPSFELYDTCPTNLSQLYHALYWTNPLATSTPDYFNSCTGNWVCSVPDNHFGNEPAHFGNAYAGICTASYSQLQPVNYREYLQAELLDTLNAGLDYCIRFYVSAADSARYISNNIGVYFSPTEIQDTCPISWCNLSYVPQFENPSNNNLNSRNGWTEISGSYTASGGEKYIVIGNFRDSSATVTTFTGWSANQLAYYVAYYYIDDVLVTPCDSLTALNENQFIKNEFLISPNPAGEFTVIKGVLSQLTSVILMNELGETIKKYNSKNIIAGKIELADLPQGFYLLSIITKQNKITYPLIIIHN